MKYASTSALLLTLIAAPAMAHVTASPDTGKAGNYFQTSLRVTHGCDISHTMEIRVKIPDGVLSVHPQAKPGWKITTTKHKLEQPIVSHKGKTITEAVDEVVWSGGALPSDQYDDFGLVMKLPDTPDQTLWFPTVQKCKTGENRWIEIPTVGQEWRDLKRPAPFVKLTASAN